MSEISNVVQWVKNLTAMVQAAAKVQGQSLALAQWVKGSGIAAAAAQIQPLAWELPYASGGATKKKKKLLWLSRIIRVGLWTGVHLLPRLTAFLIKVLFLSTVVCLSSYWL